MAEKINPLPDTNEIQLSQLAAAQQRFIRAWKPEQIRRIEEFERELYYLIHLAAQVAIAPVLKQMTAMAATRVQPLYIADPKKPSLSPEIRK